ncbi:NfeD family protein [Candidatus Photodesmus katoptron]|nr:NfeD family protein [Candidatus Photodesmus katoptron]
MEYLSYSLVILGIILITIEVSIFGISTFVFLFAGLGMISSGFLMIFSFINSSFISAFLSTSILTILFFLILWKPFKILQNKLDTRKIKTDFHSKEFILENDIDILSKSTHWYSGIQWEIKCLQPIKKGTLVQIDKIEVGVLWVKKKY